MGYITTITTAQIPASTPLCNKSTCSSKRTKCLYTSRTFCRELASLGSIDFQVLYAGSRPAHAPDNSVTIACTMTTPFKTSSEMDLRLRPDLSSAAAPYLRVRDLGNSFQSYKPTIHKLCHIGLIVPARCKIPYINVDMIAKHEIQRYEAYSGAMSSALDITCFAILHQLCNFVLAWHNDTSRALALVSGLCISASVDPLMRDSASDTTEKILSIVRTNREVP